MAFRSWRTRWPAAALLAGAALAGGSAAGYAVARPPNHDYGIIPPVGQTAAASAPAPGPGVPAPEQARPGPDRTAGGLGPAVVTVVRAPARLRIPAIGVNAPVVPVGVQAGGWLAIPPDPSDVGWWAGGGFPGQPAGATILAGHIDSAASGPGALLRLQDARPGDGVTVVAGGRAYRYRVAALRAYPKAGLPSAAVFGQQVTARLVIVSCGGPYDPATGHYLDNIVAYAVPASGA